MPAKRDHGITVIEGPAIRAEIDALKRDPIIHEMHRTLQPDADVYEWAFIRAAGDEYRKRGGKHQLTIGGPARAIQLLRRDPTITPITTTEEVNAMPNENIQPEAVETEAATEETPAEETPAEEKPKRERKPVKANLQPLKRPVKLTMQGASAASAPQSRYVHIIRDGEKTCLCGIKASDWKARAELDADAKINCPVCAKLQREAAKDQDAS